MGVVEGHREGSKPPFTHLRLVNASVHWGVNSSTLGKCHLIIDQRGWNSRELGEHEDCDEGRGANEGRYFHELSVKIIAGNERTSGGLYNLIGMTFPYPR